MGMLGLLTLVGAACSSSTKQAADKDRSFQQSVSQAPTKLSTQSAVAKATDGCELRDVRFDYDSSNLSESSQVDLRHNAECIKKQSFSQVQVTGMTDPRGTEEYNLALGDRRASMATQYLETLAVSARVSKASVGEEYSQGSDETSWKLDRRAQIRANK